MRRNKKEIKDILELKKIINSATIMHLGLCNNNQPYVVPLNFGFEDMIIYFHSAKEGKKCDWIKGNQLCAVEMTSYFELIKGEEACQWSAYHESVMIEGVITLLDNIDEIKIAMNTIMNKYGFVGEPFYQDKFIKAMNVYKIDIKTISGKRNLPNNK